MPLFPHMVAFNTRACYKVDTVKLNGEWKLNAAKGFERGGGPCNSFTKEGPTLVILINGLVSLCFISLKKSFVIGIYRCFFFHFPHLISLSILLWKVCPH